MFNRVLIPLDGSPLSEQVIPYAVTIARLFESDVELICAVEDEDLPAEAIDELEQSRKACLQRVADNLPKPLKPVVHCVHGHPAQAIVDEAERLPDTLVTMATHGYSGIQRWLLGSVAHKVVQVVDSPVLLLPSGATSPSGGPVELERIIVPLDGSDLAEQILPHVRQLSAALDMEVILVRAYNPSFPGSTIRMQEVSKIVHDAAEHYLQGIIQQLRDQGLSKVTYEVLRGIPAEQITQFALDTPNSITAMCTHGRHGIGRWLLGSVTDAVIHSSEEPVLVIRSSQPSEPTGA
jgi:nucleotide-binding universal stress UspA family protein